MVNGEKETPWIFTAIMNGDCILHIEFTVPGAPTQGCIFMACMKYRCLTVTEGEGGFIGCGGIYARYRDGRTYEGHPPRVNASKAPENGRVLM